MDNEIEISIVPKMEALQTLGILPQELEEALPAALEAYQEEITRLGTDAVEVPTLESAVVVIHGDDHRLGSLADIVRP